MQEPHAGADRPVGGVVIPPFAVVVARPQLDELHEVVFGAHRHLEPAHPRRGEIVAPVRPDGYFVGIGEERIQRHARREIHRQRIVRFPEVTAQIAQLAADAQRRVAADVLQRQRPRRAQVDGQCVGRVVVAFEVHVAPHDADGPPLAQAARIAQVDGHVVVAPFAQVLPPADLCHVDVVEPAEPGHGIVVELALPVVGRGDLRGHLRKDGRRRIIIDGVRTRQGRHGYAAHAERLGVGCRERSLLRRGIQRGGKECQGGCQTFHTANIAKKMQLPFRGVACARSVSTKSVSGALPPVRRSAKYAPRRRKRG